MSEEELDGGRESRLRITRGPAEEVVLVGEIDMSTAPQLHHALTEAGRGGAALTLDLQGVTYLDSAAVAKLFEHAKTKQLTLLIATGSVTETVTRVCGLQVVTTVQLLPRPCDADASP